MYEIQPNGWAKFLFRDIAGKPWMLSTVSKQNQAAGPKKELSMADINPLPHWYLGMCQNPGT